MVRKKKSAPKKIPAPPGENASWQEQSAYFEKYGLEELEESGYLQELSPSEKRFMNRVTRAAQARVTKRMNRAQLNLSFAEEKLKQFVALAEKRHIPPSTLAKSWILERLDQECASDYS